MKIQFKQEISEVDSLIVLMDTTLALSPLLQEIDTKVNGCVRFNMKREHFRGNKDEVVEFTTNGLHAIPKVILVGIGQAPMKPLEWQELGGCLLTYLKGHHIAIEAPAEWIADIALGMQLRSWHFTKYHTIDVPSSKGITFLAKDPAHVQSLFAKQDPLYQGVILARDLTVEPANHLYPDAFAQRCLELRHHGVEVDIMDETALEKMGAQAILNVGKSSVHPPRLVVMRWKGGDKKQPPIALVGKGICFDSGGINIKTKELVEMKFDKAGAAAVTGTILAMAMQKAPVNLVGVIGLAENMIDGASMKPGDVITTLSGKTVEVVDTDYEGRLILADCLWYAQQHFHPSTIIDLGTLTPETIAPLADEYAGLYCEDEKLTASLFQAGIRSGEKVWHLPMGASYARQIKSDYADIKNMGIPGFGEGAAAAEFLKCFVKPDVRWAHLDIAGVAWTLDHCSLNRKGITGFGVRLLSEWLIKAHERFALIHANISSS